MQEAADPLLDPDIQVEEDPGIKAEPPEWEEVAFETVDDEDYKSSIYQTTAGSESANPDLYPFSVQETESPIEALIDLPTKSSEEHFESEEDNFIESVDMYDEDDCSAFDASQDDGLDYDLTQLEDAEDEDVDPLDIGPQNSQEVIPIYPRKLTPDKKRQRTNVRYRRLKFQWNQCKIHCPLCAIFHTSVYQYYNHLKSKHNTNIKETPLDKGSILPKHTCLICTNIQIIFDQNSVRAHLLRQHNVSLIGYENQFTSELIGLFSDSKEGAIPAYKIAESVSKELKYQWDQCEVHCALCSMLFTSMTKYYQHLYVKHRSSIKEHPISSGNILAKHTCLICQNVHNFDEGSVSAHLKKFHNISLIDYEDQFSDELEALFSSNLPTQRKELKFNWDQCQISCSLCERQYKSLSKYYQHLKHAHQTTIKKTPLDMASLVRKHKCLVCFGKQITFDEWSIRAHLRKSHNMSIGEYETKFSKDLMKRFPGIIGDAREPEKKIMKHAPKNLKYQWDQCEVYCALCSIQFTSIPKYYQHLYQKHQTNIKQHPLGSDSVLPKHTCLLCNNVFIFDESRVSIHMKNIHKISLREYEQQFPDELQALFSKSKTICEKVKFEWDQCKIPCALCQQLFQSLTKYYQHLYYKHRTSIKHHPLGKDSVLAKHKCFICKNVHNFDEGRVSVHLKKFHHISLIQYEQQFPDKLKALFKSLKHKK